MRISGSLFLLAALMTPLFGGDFDLVIKSARQAWPERNTVIVVCNKDASSMALMDLGSATENVINLMVVDLANAKEIERVVSTVGRKPKNEVFVLMIADDPLTGDGTRAGEILVARMTQRGIPVAGTTPGAIKFGAVFALGTGTKEKMLINPEAAKKLGVPLPEAPTQVN